MLTTLDVNCYVLMYSFFPLIAQIKALTPYCSDGLLKFTLTDEPERLNDYFLNAYKVTSNKGPTSSCIIDREHALNVNLNRLVAISGIVLDSDTYCANNNCNHLHSSYEIAVSRNISSDHRLTFKCKPNRHQNNTGKYISFNCHNIANIHPSTPNLYIDSITLKSKEETVLNLTKNNNNNSGFQLYALNEKGFCLPPASKPDQRYYPVKNHYSINENVTYNNSREEIGYQLVVSQPYVRQCIAKGWSEEPLRLPPSMKELHIKNDGVHTEELFHSYSEMWTSYRTATLTRDRSLSFNISENYGISLITVKIALNKTKEQWNLFFEEPLVISNGSKTMQWNISTGSCTQQCDLIELIPVHGEKSIDCQLCNASFTVKRQDDIAVYKEINIEYWSRTQQEAFKRLFHQQCPPIDPYYGMPMYYSENDLLIDKGKEINRLIKLQPCREGFVERNKTIADPLRCENASWKGARPRCEMITCKALPPFVKNGKWSYLYDDLFHVVKYMCNDGTSEYVKCIRDKWINVPTCDRRNGSNDKHKNSSNIPMSMIVIISVMALIIIVLSILLTLTRATDTSHQAIARLDEPFYTGTLKSVAHSRKKTKNEVPIIDDCGSMLAVYREDPVYANAQVLFTNNGTNVKRKDMDGNSMDSVLAEVHENDPPSTPT